MYLHLTHKHTVRGLCLNSKPSTSSDEDEFERQPREFQTGSSDEEEAHSSQRASLYHPKSLAKITAIEPRPDRETKPRDKMEIDNAIGDCELGRRQA